MVKGFKVFNSDWTCRDFQYEVGQTYEKNVIPRVCDRGLHFCKQARDCFNYYSFDPNNKVAEVIALGEVAEEGDKCSTNKLQIVREISWEELLTLVNTGKGNSGYRNSGDWNSGYRNSGDWNSGDRNRGHRNSGDRNSGHRNSGDRNSGHWNSGDWNSGHRNSGHSNSGHRNSGHLNSGDRNSGHSNSGDFNSGNYNSGEFNSGEFNSGDSNSGDWNKASNVAGCFNTEQHKLIFFDKETDMTFDQWRKSAACFLLSRIKFRTTQWVSVKDMTDEEKDSHPEYKTTGGYLKSCDGDKAFQSWWDSLNDEEKEIIKNIPNFNNEKFYEITKIRVS